MTVQPPKPTDREQPKVKTSPDTAKPTGIFTPSLPEFQRRRDELFKKACDAAAETFRSKNIEYRDAITETGALGATVELVGISARLKALIVKDSQHGRASKKNLQEIAKDALVYSNILMQMISEDNWDGE